MNKQFYQQIFDKQINIEPVPSNESLAAWGLKLICLLYPEKAECYYSSAEVIGHEFDKLEKELVIILNATKACSDCNNEAVAKAFFENMPELYRLLNTDIQAILNGDPAAHSEFEIIFLPVGACIIQIGGACVAAHIYRICAYKNRH
jgi:serine O-acetyltransferase